MKKLIATCLWVSLLTCFGPSSAQAFAPGRRQASWARRRRLTKRPVDPWNDDRSIPIIINGTDVRRSQSSSFDPSTAGDDSPPTFVEAPDTAASLTSTDWLAARPRLAVVMLNLVAIIWGTQHAIIKTIVADDITSSSSAEFTLCRFALAASVALPAGLAEWLTENHPQQEKQTSPNTLALARWGAELGLWMFLGFAFQAIGLETTTAQKSGFLLYLNVKFVPFFAWIGYGRPVSTTTWISALTAVVGTALLGGVAGFNDNAPMTASQEWNVGDGWSILAAAASALFILRLESASRALPGRAAALNAVSLVTVTALATAWTAVAFNGDTSAAADWAHLSDTFTRHVGEFVYLGVVTTAVANWIQTSAQRYVSAERASLIYAMDPVYGAAFSYSWLGESLPGLLGWIGAALIAAAAASNAWLEWEKTELPKELTTDPESRLTTKSLLDDVPRGGAINENEDAQLDAFIAELLDENDEHKKEESGSDADTESTTDESGTEASFQVTDESSAKQDRDDEETKKALPEVVSTKEKTSSNPATLAGTSNEGISPLTWNQTSSTLSDARERSPPPNGLFRFFLDRFAGYGGRSLVMLLVGIAEFCHTYIPPLALLGSWAWASVFPAASGGIKIRSRPRFTTMNAASLDRLAQTGMSRKKRRKLTEQADRQALRQLQRRPALSESRYAFCSEDFLRRHGLGKYASTRKDQENHGEEPETEVDEKFAEDTAGDSGVVIEHKKKKKKLDWVLAALTKEPRHSHESRVTLDIGSDGLTIGFEMDRSGQKERVRAALTLPSKSSAPLKSSSVNLSQRKRDVDGGVVGRLRAAAGSSMARSLSGAYPGDALGVEDAGSSVGLADFAARYGYGDWIDKQKQKRKSSSDIWLGDFDMPTSSSFQPSRRIRRTLSPEPAVSHTLSRKRSRTESSRSGTNPKETGPPKGSSPSRVELNRPAMSRITELKKKRSKKKRED